MYQRRLSWRVVGEAGLDWCCVPRVMCHTIPCHARPREAQVAAVVRSNPYPNPEALHLRSRSYNRSGTAPTDTLYATFNWLELACLLVRTRFFLSDLAQKLVRLQHRVRGLDTPRVRG